MLSRGLTLEGLNHRDMLDISYALVLEPAAHDPKARDEIIAKLAEPLPGTKKAKKKVTTDALAAMGLDLNAARRSQAEKRARAKAADTAPS